MRLALCEGSPANMHGRIEAACALARDPASRERLFQLQKLSASNPDAWRKVRAAAAAVAHDADLP
ncbi:MAG: hypothetical protein MUE79_01675, partial [Nitratireductor sp.]|nr:hypothetical protein [Nitratireductor sp.]